MSGGTAETRCWVRHTTDGGTIYTLFNGESVGEVAEIESLSTDAGESCTDVSPARPAIVWVDGREAGARGNCSRVSDLRWKQLFTADKLSIVSTLTPGDIRTNRPCCVALWPGKRGPCPVIAATRLQRAIFTMVKWRTLETRNMKGAELDFDCAPFQGDDLIGPKASLPPRPHKWKPG